MNFNSTPSVRLRPHQIECVDAFMECKDRMAHAEVTVAGGKSLVAAECARRVAPIGRVLIVTHTKELVEQDLSACHELAIPAVVCCSALSVNVTGRVTVGSIQTIVKRLSYFLDVILIVIDEVHRVPPDATDKAVLTNNQKTESQYRQLINACPNAHVFGVSGTTFRVDGSGDMSDSFGPCVYRYTFAEALEDGFVKPLRAIDAGDEHPDSAEGSDLRISTHGLKIDASGEWSGRELTNRCIQYAPAHAAASVAALRSEGRYRNIVFACNIEHAETLEKEYRKLGVYAFAVHSRLKGNWRDDAVAAFREGRLEYFVSVAAFNTGFNVPDIDGMVLARPIRSRLLYAQSLGRGARLSQLALDCCVVDFGGNVARHGPLDMLKLVKRKEASDATTQQILNTIIEALSSRPPMIGVGRGAFLDLEERVFSEKGATDMVAPARVEIALILLRQFLPDEEDRIAKVEQRLLVLAERTPEEIGAPDLGKDLRIAATSKHQIIANVKQSPRWIEAHHQPGNVRQAASGRAMFYIGTQIGDAKWLSAHWPTECPPIALNHVFVRYHPRYGLVADGVMDANGRIFQVA